MKVVEERCIYCAGCVGVCPHDAIELRETKIVFFRDKCTECNLCHKFCPTGAIEAGVW